MTKLEQLKKEIKRLRPEIMELKFGCELLWHDNQVHKIIEINQDKFWTDLTNNHCGHNFGFTLKVDLQTEVKEILGRTITLEDVLFCCVEAYSKFGIITKKSYEEMLGGVVGLWNFSKDFDNQSEEFYDEIMFLLEK